MAGADAAPAPAAGTKRPAEDELHRDDAAARKVRASVRVLTCERLTRVRAQPVQGADVASPPASPAASDSEAPDEADAQAAAHPWVGVWDLFTDEACAAGKCRSSHCKGAMIPGLVIEEEDDMLHVSGFTFKALPEPFSDDPWDYPDGAFVSAADAVSRPVTLDFEGGDLGCGVESVTVSLHLTPDAERGGAPSRAVKLRFDVRLGSLYTRKGYHSWDGGVSLIMQRRAEDAAPSGAAA
jgi:hypothetical protein